MKSHILVFVAIASLCAAMPASAARVLELIEDAYEVRAADVQLPTERGRTLYVKTCSVCAPTAMQVDEKTGFFDGGSTVAYSDFRELLRDHYDSAVYVFYRPGTDEVTRIVLSATARPSASPATRPARPAEDDQRRRPGFRSDS